MQVEQLRKSLLGLSEAELSSSGAAEPAGTRHRGSRCSSLPAASPTTLEGKGNWQKRCFTPQALSPREDEGDAVVELSAGAAAAQPPACPPCHQRRGSDVTEGVTTAASNPVLKGP